MEFQKLWKDIKSFHIGVIDVPSAYKSYEYIKTFKKNPRKLPKWEDKFTNQRNSVTLKQGNSKKSSHPYKVR